MGLKIFSSSKTKYETAPTAGSAKKRGAQKQVYEPADKIELDPDPLRQCQQLERYGTIITHQSRWIGHPALPEVLRQVVQAVDEQFGMVPEGFASLPQTVSDAPGCPEHDVVLEPFLIARFTITNRQFQKFVDAGGYQELELWPKDIWPHLIDFKDLTGESAPRYWRGGRHNKRLAQHPVVGVCYYEAAAYARWAGYRLPNEAEWQMAASWRIRSSAHVMRRYPWGDALDISRCNIWASGVGTTVEVQGYPEGSAPNGVRQLIGNVWEWTASDFMVTDDAGQPVVGDMPMKSIRGGSFDTYFPAQSTSAFRTGLATLMRPHNVGFRCAADMNLVE